jgi:hypothetical protein
MAGRLNDNEVAQEMNKMVFILKQRLHLLNKKRWKKQEKQKSRYYSIHIG